MHDFIVDTGGLRGGLLTEAVLGTPEQVCAGLNESFVLQHDCYMNRGKLNRNAYNRNTPSTVFHQNRNGAQLLGGGIEAGLMPMGDAAGLRGLRPLLI